jgi:predicted ATPase/class 3 adenylate cyclase
MQDTVFLFTDIEGSTRLWEQQPSAMSTVMTRHDALLREIVLQHGGIVVKMSGDGIHAAFLDAPQALNAAVAMQLCVRDISSNTLLVAIRCALHVGPAEARDGDYFGTTVNRAARLCGAANGGQIILSDAVRARVAENLPAPLRTRHLGVVRLRDLTEAETVHQLMHPDLPSEFPPLRTLSTNPNNIPFFANAFIGRYREIGDIGRLVQQSRLVTLLGAGGIGKTRLAIQAAAYLLEQFPDGVWICELAKLDDPTLIPIGVMQTLGVKTQGAAAPTEQITRFCRDKKILLLIDNCEHLIDEVAQFISCLLRDAPHLRVLATSREGIEIDGEAAYQVPVLSIPDPDFVGGTGIDNVTAIREIDSVRLFLDRALGHRPDFVLTTDDVSTLARICYRLDGIPLAIELAAARLRSMSLQEIDRGMDDRFGLLVVGSRVAAPRHKTLQATLEWSYGLLSAEEQALFDQLAVFVGGGAFDAVTALAGAVPQAVEPQLESLADKSLIQLFEVEGQRRFSVLETMRQFATQKASATHRLDGLVQAHAIWHCQFAVAVLPKLFGEERARLLAHLDADQANLRAALAHLVTAEPLVALDMCLALGRYWLWRGQYAEAKQFIEAALDAQLRVGTIPELIEAKSRYFAGGHCYMLSDLENAERHYQLALSASQRINDEANAGMALAALGSVAYVQRGYAAAKPLHSQGIELLLRGGDNRNAAIYVANLVNNAAYADDALVVEQGLTQLEALAAQLNEPMIHARLLSSKGQFALHRGLYTDAVNWFTQNLALAQKNGDRSQEGIAQFLLGAALTGHGALSDAARAFCVGIKLLSEQDARIELCNALEAFAFWCSRRGDDFSAVQICAATLVARDKIGFPVGAQAKEARRRALAASESKMDDAERAKAHDIGDRMRLEDAATLAYNLASAANESALALTS